MSEEAGTPSGVLGALGRIADIERRRLEDVLSTIAETAARTLDIDRVNIWLYDEARRQIECIEGYESPTNRHTRGAILLAADYPHYFAALDTMRSVTVLDVESDPRTRELLESYCAPLGIGSMLDVPILSSGRVIGVVCHEHVGGTRGFLAWERYFAASIGDLVALALETERRIAAERERTRLTERLSQVRRFESLGILAGGVAHDLRNLLMIVGASVDVLARHAGEPGAAASSDILEAARRSKELCDLLLAYAGRSELQPSRVALAPLISEMQRLLGSRVPPGARVELEVDPELPDVWVDPTAVRQIVMNLLLNAFDALGGGGGRIRVRVRCEEPSSELVWDFRKEGSPSLLLEIEDDGGGMAPDTQQRIFDPFFTTKPNGHGLGLASVLGIVRAHAGALEVKSELGRGTTLRVWLPIAGTS